MKKLHTISAVLAGIVASIVATPLFAQNFTVPIPVGADEAQAGGIRTKVDVTHPKFVISPEAEWAKNFKDQQGAVMVGGKPFQVDDVAGVPGYLPGERAVAGVNVAGVNNDMVDSLGNRAAAGALMPLQGFCPEAIEPQGQYFAFDCQLENTNTQTDRQLLISDVRSVDPANEIEQFVGQDPILIALGIVANAQESLLPYTSALYPATVREPAGSSYSELGQNFNDGYKQVITYDIADLTLTGEGGKPFNRAIATAVYDIVDLDLISELIPGYSDNLINFFGRNLFEPFANAVEGALRHASSPPLDGNNPRWAEHPIGQQQVFGGKVTPFRPLAFFRADQEQDRWRLGGYSSTLQIPKRDILTKGNGDTVQAILASLLGENWNPIAVVPMKYPRPPLANGVIECNSPRIDPAAPWINLQKASQIAECFPPDGFAVVNQGTLGSLDKPLLTVTRLDDYVWLRDLYRAIEGDLYNNRAYDEDWIQGPYKPAAEMLAMASVGAQVMELYEGFQGGIASGPTLHNLWEYLGTIDPNVIEVNENGNPVGNDFTPLGPALMPNRVFSTIVFWGRGKDPHTQRPVEYGQSNHPIDTLNPNYAYDNFLLALAPPEAYDAVEIVDRLPAGEQKSLITGGATAEDRLNYLYRFDPVRAQRLYLRWPIFLPSSPSQRIKLPLPIIPPTEVRAIEVPAGGFAPYQVASVHLGDDPCADILVTFRGAKTVRLDNGGGDFTNAYDQHVVFQADDGKRAFANEARIYMRNLEGDRCAFGEVRTLRPRGDAQITAVAVDNFDRNGGPDCMLGDAIPRAIVGGPDAGKFTAHAWLSPECAALDGAAMRMVRTGHTVTDDAPGDAPADYLLAAMRGEGNKLPGVAAFDAKGSNLSAVNGTPLMLAPQQACPMPNNVAVDSIPELIIAKVAGIDRPQRCGVEFCTGVARDGVRYTKPFPIGHPCCNPCPNGGFIEQCRSVFFGMPNPPPHPTGLCMQNLEGSPLFRAMCEDVREQCNIQAALAAPNPPIAQNESDSGGDDTEFAFVQRPDAVVGRDRHGIISAAAIVEAQHVMQGPASAAVPHDRAAANIEAAERAKIDQMIGMKGVPPNVKGLDAKPGAQGGHFIPWQQVMPPNIAVPAAEDAAKLEAAERARINEMAGIPPGDVGVVAEGLGPPAPAAAVAEEGVAMPFDLVAKPPVDDGEALDLEAKIAANKAMPFEGRELGGLRIDPAVRIEQNADIMNGVQFQNIPKIVEKRAAMKMAAFAPRDRDVGLRPVPQAQPAVAGGRAPGNQRARFVPFPRRFPRGHVMPGKRELTVLINTDLSQEWACNANGPLEGEAECNLDNQVCGERGQICNIADCKCRASCSDVGGPLQPGWECNRDNLCGAGQICAINDAGACACRPSDATSGPAAVPLTTVCQEITFPSEDMMKLVIEKNAVYESYSGIPKNHFLVLPEHRVQCVVSQGRSVDASGSVLPFVIVQKGGAPFIKAEGYQWRIVDKPVQLVSYAGAPVQGAAGWAAPSAVSPLLSGAVDVMSSLGVPQEFQSSGNKLSLNGDVFTVTVNAVQAGSQFSISSAVGTLNLAASEPGSVSTIEMTMGPACPQFTQADNYQEGCVKGDMNFEQIDRKIKEQLTARSAFKGSSAIFAGLDGLEPIYYYRLSQTNMVNAPAGGADKQEQELALFNSPYLGVSGGGGCGCSLEPVSFGPSAIVPVLIVALGYLAVRMHIHTRRRFFRKTHI